jgi:hypothetical protein
MADDSGRGRKQLYGALVFVAALAARDKGRRRAGLLTAGFAAGLLLCLKPLAWRNVNAAAAALVAALTWQRVLDPLRVNAYRYLAHYHLLRGGPARAREIMNEGLHKAEETAAKGNDAVSLFWLAQFEFHSGAPLSQVSAATTEVRAKGPPRWVSVQLELMERELSRRTGQGDDMVEGMRI